MELKIISDRTEPAKLPVWFKDFETVMNTNRWNSKDSLNTLKLLLNDDFRDIIESSTCYLEVCAELKRFFSQKNILKDTQIC